jgi:hypothetical protein
MFDRAVSMSMSLAASPHLNGAALTALKILLVDCGSGSDPLADRPDSDAGSDTRNPNRGDDHGVPARTPAKPNTVRSLRSAGGGPPVATPAWQLLPEGARLTATKLMARLLVDHERADREERRAGGRGNV